MTTPAHIRFVLDGTAHDVPALDPNTTLLTYLRDELGRRGTKEGCAEGDCGACTVVVTEPGPDGALRYRPINACIALLASVDGRELLTVESLSARREPLHPVQEAMVTHHGSQCGFCTPGIVMSLFALYKQRDSITREDVNECLAGNLCRCTGYRPIVDAGLAMHDVARGRIAHSRLTRLPGVDGEEESQLREQLCSWQRADGARFANAMTDTVLDMPASLTDALDILARAPDATVVAGGTDLGLRITKSHERFKHLVGLGRIEALHGIRKSADTVRIGAATPLEDVYLSLRGLWPALDELWSRFASPPIRHAATLGGNIANGSPIGDSMPALMVLDAELELVERDGSRRVPLADFYAGYRQTVLRPGELIAAIHLPMPRADTRYFVRKVAKRYDQDISAVCVAFNAKVSEGVLSHVRVALGGMAATPSRARATEAALAGARPQEEGEALESRVRLALVEDFQPISDFRASAGYRIQVAGNVMNHFLWQLATGPVSHD